MWLRLRLVGMPVGMIMMMRMRCGTSWFRFEGIKRYWGFFDIFRNCSRHYDGSCGSNAILDGSFGYLYRCHAGDGFWAILARRRRGFCLWSIGGLGMILLFLRRRNFGRWRKIRGGRECNCRFNFCSWGFRGRGCGYHYFREFHPSRGYNRLSCVSRRVGLLR